LVVGIFHLECHLLAINDHCAARPFGSDGGSAFEFICSAVETDFFGIQHLINERLAAQIAVVKIKIQIVRQILFDNQMREVRRGIFAQKQTSRRILEPQFEFLQLIKFSDYLAVSDVSASCKRPSIMSLPL